MEPFGLFQFLQSLLQNPSPPAENTTQNQEENNAHIPPENARKNPPPSVSDTYLQFCANHEKRAHNIKKK